MNLLAKARSHGFEVKAIFVGTEHPDLNIAWILSRVSRGGLFAPIANLDEEYQNGLRELKTLAKAADELVLLDNTAEGRAPRVIAQFVNGDIVKLARSMPEWAQRVFGKEFIQRLGSGIASTRKSRRVSSGSTDATIFIVGIDCLHAKSKRRVWCRKSWTSPWLARGK
jgi:hypothetical protein